MDAEDDAKRLQSGDDPGKRPLPNTYWVEPGRLLAGEYPGATTRAATRKRLQRLLDAGIDTFIDLTEADELPAYIAVLSAIDPTIRHQRFPVVDHGVPDNPEFVRRVLDGIDQALAAGRRPYVHCRAGVGRTGTVIGCYLIRRGLPGPAALDRLATLWRQSERSRVIPQVPETPAQAGFVRSWREAQPGGAEGMGTGRILGALFGLAAGEASCSQLAGTTPGNTAMTVLLAESLLSCSGVDLDDQMQRYLGWQQEARTTETAVAVPQEVRRALAAWQWTRKPYAGSHDPANLDAHSLARTTAVALYFRSQPIAALDAAAEVSRTTIQSPVVLDACRAFAAYLLTALAGVTKQQILTLSAGLAASALRGRTLKLEVRSLIDAAWHSAAQPSGTADAIGTLSIALWSFARTAGFAEGLALATRSSRTPGTAAAVYGSLAGAHYSAAALPSDLRKAVGQPDSFAALAQRLAAATPGSV